LPEQNALLKAEIKRANEIHNWLSNTGWSYRKEGQGSIFDDIVYYGPLVKGKYLRMSINPKRSRANEPKCTWMVCKFENGFVEHAGHDLESLMKILIQLREVQNERSKAVL